MAKALAFGDVVRIPWGVDEVEGTVQEIYGEPPRVHVVIELTPERSSYVVHDRTTVTMPLDVVTKVA